MKMKFNQDDILESSLKSLKNGIPLEEVLRNLPPEDFEVADLDRLVQAFRALSHPRLSASRAKYQLNKVLSLWDDQKIKYFASKEKKVKFQFAPIFAVLAIILISVLVLNVINHSMAAPEDITGIAMTSPTGGEWTQLQSGEGLAQGSWVRTYAD
jgi:hypothetical protein